MQYDTKSIISCQVFFSKWACLDGKWYFTDGIKIPIIVLKSLSER